MRWYSVLSCLKWPVIIVTVAVVIVLLTFIGDGSFWRKKTTYKERFDHEQCFRAAVYEHIRLPTIKENLAVYEKVAEDAARYGAQMIVFPENGIYHPKMGHNLTENRKLLKPLLEHVPRIEANSSFFPCKDQEFENSKIIKTLACAAALHEIYLVADFGAFELCTTNNETNNETAVECPEDEFFAYNTQVVFDNRGQLIARYRKRNLFGEYFYNVPELEHVTFETPFGKFGLFICFDLIFKEPGITLVEDYNVTTMVMSMNWIGERPALTAHQYLHAWSFANNINLLASNVHNVSTGTTGSGIYAGNRGPVVYNFDINRVKPSFSKLMIATLAQDSKSGAKCDPDLKVVNVRHREDHGDYFSKQISMDVFVKKRLTPPTGGDEFGIETALGTNKQGCVLWFKVKPEDYPKLHDYYLIFANTTHPGKWPVCEDYCFMSRLDNETNTFVDTGDVIFDLLKIDAEFTTNYTYPSVVGNDFKLIDHRKWHYVKKVKKHVLTIVTDEPIVNAGFYGRCYYRDPEYTRD